MTSKNKSELVKMYNVSRFTFGNYINNGGLFQKLSKTGYCKKNRLLTPLQISLIIEHLGDPFDN
jgi:hypothetical protein